MIVASALYGAALLDHPGRAGAAPIRWRVRYHNGRSKPLALARWRGPVDAADTVMLSRCDAPTLDVGCGPGRLVSALTAEGRPALGVDISPVAVMLARRAGAPVIRRSVFDALPAEGQWRTVLLADGNVGIGGDVGRLLRRCRELCVEGGRVIVELDPPGVTSGAVRVRVETSNLASSWFDWAELAADEIEAPARAAGLRIEEQWNVRDRWFAALGR